MEGGNGDDDATRSSEYTTAVCEPISCSWNDPMVAELALSEQSMGEHCSQYATAVEAEIEASKVHWSELSSDLIMDKEEEKKHIAEDNRRVLKDLMQQWPNGLFRIEKFELGKKIAEGAQAEIYESKTRGNDGPVVLKVFKEGSSLRNLQKQWPLGLLQNCNMLNVYSSWIGSATLLEDGRFAFEMWRYGCDLRKLIDIRMHHKHNEGRPFTLAQAYRIMWAIAKGMEELLCIDVPHRDLKASNVLVRPAYDDSEAEMIYDPRYNKHFTCFVADYECSVGVVGTGFWRAPEILRAVKDGSIYDKPELFSKSADVYSYAMTCYEVLTGKYPFEDLGRSNYEAVFSGQRRLEWPQDIEPRIKVLLQRCAHLDPLERPAFDEILRVLEN